MAYRYTNTDKWGDAWFLSLKPLSKLLFNYLTDNCDIAGFIELNPKIWASEIGSDKKNIEGALKGLQRGLIYSITNDCIFIKNYLKHQKNLPLIPEKNPAHKGIIKRFELYSFKFNIVNIEDFIEGASKGLNSPLGNGNGNGKDNGSGKEKKIDFNFDFVENEWKELFNEWLNYKKSRKEYYKTQQSVEACFRNLKTLSKNDIKIGRKVLDKSMGNNYQGLVPFEEMKISRDYSDIKVSTKYIDEYESNRK